MSLTARITSLAQAVGGDIKTALAHIGSRGSAHGVATTSEAGFLSATDKTKLDSMSEGASGDANAAVATHAGAADPHGLTYPLTPGGYAVDITGYDLNSLYRTGFYRGYGLVHAPLDNGGWWHVLIASGDANWVKQTATAFGSGNNAGDIYERVCNAGVWTAWAKVFKQGTAIDGTPIGQTTPAAGAFTTLSASGNVGIGVAVASALLHVRGTSAPEILLQNDTSTSLGRLGFYSGTTLDGYVGLTPNTGTLNIESGRSVGWGGKIVLTTDAVERARIDSTGLSVTGNLTATGRLTTAGITEDASGLSVVGNISASNTNSIYKLALDVNNVVEHKSEGWGAAQKWSVRDGSYNYSSMTLDASGNLEVGGGGTFGGAVSAAGLSLGGNTLALAESGVRSWELQATGGNVRLSSGDGNGAFVGAGDGTMNLGAYDKRWNRLFAHRLAVGPYTGYQYDWHSIHGINGNGHILLAMDSASTGAASVLIYECTEDVGSLPDSVMHVARNVTTGRSISVKGTVNVAGADYAEHEQNNGHRIIKGQIVGFDADGKLTTLFSEALRFAVKSTEPGYTGGNTWMDSLPPRPNKPVLHDVQRRSYGEADEVNPDAEVDALIEQEYQEALVAAEIEYQSELAQYERDKTAFDKAMAEAVSKVDRIAYCGKVPVNYQGADAGQYLIAKAMPDDSIGCYAVYDPTFQEYLHCIGRVNKVLPDGRAEIAVIIH